ncbi:MAG: type II toxin-antitoxin system Phd/YefM family antitoxin [Pseudonocardiaceae bacterium]
MAMSASEACKRLFPLIEQVNDPQEPVETVSKADTATSSPPTSGVPWRQPISRGPLANAERVQRSIATPKSAAPESSN